MNAAGTAIVSNGDDGITVNNADNSIIDLNTIKGNCGQRHRRTQRLAAESDHPEQHLQQQRSRH